MSFSYPPSQFVHFPVVELHSLLTQYAGHDVHVVDFVTFAYVPDKHNKQTDEDVAPITDDAVPIGQSMHFVPSDEYVPAGQERQLFPDG